MGGVSPPYLPSPIPGGSASRGGRGLSKQLGGGRGRGVAAGVFGQLEEGPVLGTSGSFGKWSRPLINNLASCRTQRRGWEARWRTAGKAIL